MMLPREGSSTLTTPMSSALTSICRGDTPKPKVPGPGGCTGGCPWTPARGASALTRIPTLQFSAVSCFPFRHSSFGTLHSRQSMSCCQGCGFVSDPIPDPDPTFREVSSPTPDPNPDPTPDPDPFSDPVTLAFASRELRGKLALYS